LAGGVAGGVAEGGWGRAGGGPWEGRRSGQRSGLRNAQKTAGPEGQWLRGRAGGGAANKDRRQGVEGLEAGTKPGGTGVQCTPQNKTFHPKINPF